MIPVSIAVFFVVLILSIFLSFRYPKMMSRFSLGTIFFFGTGLVFFQQAEVSKIPEEFSYSNYLLSQEDVAYVPSGWPKGGEVIGESTQSAQNFEKDLKIQNLISIEAFDRGQFLLDNGEISLRKNIFKIQRHAIEGSQIDSNSITSRTIQNGAILDRDISLDARIALSKIEIGEGDLDISQVRNLQDSLDQKLSVSGDMIDISSGGTGLTSFSQGDLIFYSSGTSLSRLAKSSTPDQFLKNSGSDNSPAWATILASDISGLGSIATQDFDSVNISGGSLTGNYDNSDNPISFIFGNDTGTTDLFNLNDISGNTGTGYLLNVSTASGSLLKPLSVSASGGTFPSITVDNSGLVGIGTYDPYSQLSVVGGATFGATYSLETLADGDVAIEGSLGIGTASPKTKLDVDGPIKVGSYTTAGRPTCNANMQGAFIFDNEILKPFVCNGTIWKPLDSDFDEDGIVDWNDQDDTDPDLKDADLIPSNIKADVTIFGVTGTLTSCVTEPSWTYSIRYTTPGTGTFTQGVDSPSWINTFLVEVWGAGGGPGGTYGYGSDPIITGGGGGGGGYAAKTVTLTDGQSVSYTVGAGGNRGTNGDGCRSVCETNGTSGGDTYFGAYARATGGAGGIKDAGAGGAAGSGTIGDTLTTGSAGTAGAYNPTLGSAGNGGNAANQAAGGGQGGLGNTGIATSPTLFGGGGGASAWSGPTNGAGGFVKISWTTDNCE